MICPIKTDPNWIALEKAQPDLAYYLWNEYEGEVPQKYYQVPSAPKTLSFNLFSNEQYSKNPSLYVDQVERVVRLIENKLRIKQKPFIGKTTNKFVDKQDYVNDVLKQLLENIGLPDTISSLEELKEGLNNGSVLDYINKEYALYKQKSVDAKNKLDEVNSKVRVLNNFLTSQEVEGYSEENQEFIKRSFPALFGTLGRYKSKAQALAHYKQIVNTPKFLNKVVNLDYVKMPYFTSQSKLAKFENLLNYNELSPDDFKDRIFKTIENELNRRSEFFDSPKMQKTVLDRKEQIAKQNYKRSVKGILERFSKDENSISGKIAKVFLQHPNTLNAIKSENINRSFFGFVSGEWKGDGTLIVNYSDEKSLRHVLLHELTHHFTVPYVFTYLKNHSDPNKYVGFSERFLTQEDLNEEIEYSVKQLTKKEIESISKIEDIYIHILNLHKQGKIQFTEKQFSINPEYGLENLYEFLSEVISNPYFAAEIAKQPSLFNKKSNLLKDIIDAIFKMFGITNPSLLDDVYSLFEESFLLKDSNYNFKSSAESSSSFKYDPALNERQYQLPTQIKPGVPELFEENTELADSVYEALGFKQINAEATARVKKAEEDLRQIHKIGIDTEYEDVVKNQNKNRFHFLDTNNFKNTNQKSVNIEHIHVPEQYRNKGYGLSLYIVRGEELLKEGKYLISYDQHSPEAEIVWQRLLQLGLATQSGEYGTYQYVGLQDRITPQQKQQAQQLYSAYLDTIFKTSKVKDIVYRGDTSKQIDNRGLKDFLKGVRTDLLYLSTNADVAKDKLYRSDYSEFIYKKDDKGNLNSTSEDKEDEAKGLVRGPKNFFAAIVNLENPIIKDAKNQSYRDYEIEGQYEIDILKNAREKIKNKEADSLIVKNVLEGVSQNIQSTTIAIRLPEQIHILGDKQDIEGFKKFVQSEESSLDIDIENCNLPS